MPTAKRTYSRYTIAGITLLSKMIRYGRKRNKMTEKEMSERLGIARSTLQKVEKGDPKVELGIVFEAAALVGIKLFDSDERDINRSSELMDARTAVLPKHVYKANKKLIDDF